MLSAVVIFALLVLWTLVLAAARRGRDDTTASVEEFRKQLRAMAPAATIRNVQHPTHRP